MKLRNKKTGAIYKIEDIDLGNNADGIWLGTTKYESLAEFNEEWEDYEEPEPHFVSEFGDVYSIQGIAFDRKHIERLKEIGNYFETKEEAEKAVEKLKAWKRLKDKGFERVFSLELSDALCGGKTAEFKLLIDDKDSIEDIKLLFGSEE